MILVFVCYLGLGGCFGLRWVSVDLCGVCWVLVSLLWVACCCAFGGCLWYGVCGYCGLCVFGLVGLLARGDCVLPAGLGCGFAF